MSDTNKLVGVGAICLLLGGSLGHLISKNVSDPISAPGGMGMDKAAVAEVVKEVLNNNPQLIVDSLQNMQKKAYEEQMANAAKALKSNMKELKDTKHSPVVGKTDAAITVVEFFDYHCGYCKRMTPVMQQILEKHDDVNFVMKEFPILSEDSQLASRASLAISKLKPAKYLDYHQMLINHKGQYTQEKLNEYAGKVGVSGDELQKEMQADWVIKELESVKKLANDVGIQGTPALIIGEELVPGAVSFEDLERRINAIRDGESKNS